LINITLAKFLQSIEAMSVIDPADQLLLDARERASEGLFDEAHILYEQALGLNPNDWTAMSEHGLLYMSTKHYESAMLWLESARAINDSENLQLAAGECFLRLGLTSDAVDVLTLVLNTSPLLLQARVLIGMALNQLEKPGESLVHAEIALKVEPSNTSAQCIKAVSMCQMGLIKDALAVFNTAKSQQPSEATFDDFALFQFAEALYRHDELEQAIEQLDLLLQSDVNHVEALMLKSNALEDLGKLEEADKVMELVARLTDHLPEPEANSSS
jgi:tetratricopeptide (TPR) repeat protein